MVRGSVVAACVALVACGVPPSATEVDSVDSQLNLGVKGVEVPERDCRTVTARPLAYGTIRSAPQAEMLEVAPPGTAVQSMFLGSTAHGPEWRQGVVEFELPALGGHVVSSTLRFNDRHGYSLQAVPADVHRLTLYGADGVISTEDWLREGHPFATFETDLNELTPPERRFDITAHVQVGARLGARVELQRSTFTAGTYGSAFDGFRVELWVCGESTLPNGVPVGEPL